MSALDGAPEGKLPGTMWRSPTAGVSAILWGTPPFLKKIIFLGQHMEAPRLRVESGLQLQAYTAAAGLHHSYSNARSTEQGQGLKLHPQGYYTMWLLTH